MKKTLVLWGLAFAATLANAAYMNWQVDPSTSDNAGDFTYTAARIGYYDTAAAAGYSDLAAMDSAGKLTYNDGAYSAPNQAMGETAQYSFGASPDQYSYFIELVNYNAASHAYEHVAYSEALTYEQLVEKNYVDTGLEIGTPAVAWHGSSYNAVPEPTSVVMVMFGLAFLGLKRRTV